MKKYTWLFDFIAGEAFIILGVAPPVAKLASCFSTSIRLALVWAANAAEEGVAVVVVVFVVVDEETGGRDWEASDWLPVVEFMPAAVVEVIVQLA